VYLQSSTNDSSNQPATQINTAFYPSKVGKLNANLTKWKSPGSRSSKYDGILSYLTDGAMQFKNSSYEKLYTLNVFNY